MEQPLLFDVHNSLSNISGVLSLWFDAMKEDKGICHPILAENLRSMDKEISRLLSRMEREAPSEI